MCQLEISINEEEEPPSSPDPCDEGFDLNIANLPSDGNTCENTGFYGDGTTCIGE